MAPISTVARSFNASNSTPNGVHGITHTLNQTPFRHLSIWAYLALGFILLAVTIVLGYFVFTCYRSAAIDVESIAGTQVQVDTYTEGRSSPLSDGRKKELIQARRRGIAAFSDKAKVFGRQSQDRNNIKGRRQASAGAGAFTRQKKQYFKSPRPHVTNVVDLSIRSYSSDGDSSYAIDISSLSTPPRAYLQDSHRESSVTRPINSSANSTRSLGTAAPTTPKSPFKPSTFSTPLTTSTTLKTHTPALQRASPIDPSEIKYDSHNIRFVLPRERSMESLENARLWQDPKLSPVGGSIIYPCPNSAPQQHMPPLVGLTQLNGSGKKKSACSAASLIHGKTEGVTRWI